MNKFPIWRPQSTKPKPLSKKEVEEARFDAEYEERQQFREDLRLISENFDRNPEIFSEQRGGKQ